MDTEQLFSVATRGDPIEAIAGAHRVLSSGLGLYSFRVMHDDGCPTLDGSSLANCTCEVIELIHRRVL